MNDTLLLEDIDVKKEHNLDKCYLLVVAQVTVNDTLLLEDIDVKKEHNNLTNFARIFAADKASLEKSSLQWLEWCDCCA